MSTSFIDVTEKYLDENDIYLFIQKFSDKTDSQNNNITIYDKNEIDRILKLCSEMKLKKANGSNNSNEHTSIQLNIGRDSNLLFALMITDQGGVQIFDYKTSKHENYNISNNDFDFQLLEGLFNEVHD